MITYPLDIPWDVSLTELNDTLCAAGVEPIMLGGVGTRSARDVGMPTRIARATALRESVRRARESTVPIKDWLAASEALVLKDDGSEAARDKADAFWLSLTQIVNGCLALVMLGDLSEFPFFIELLRHQPAGHLTELATDVLCHYVDPRRELDTPRLLQRADEWWNSLA
jgi:hypothetical protein